MRLSEMLGKALRFERETMFVKTVRKNGKISHKVSFHSDQDSSIFSIPEINELKEENEASLSNNPNIKSETISRFYEHRRWYLFGRMISNEAKRRISYWNRTMNEEKPEREIYHF